MARKKSPAVALLSELADAGEWPEPDLLDRIVALGDAATPAVLAALPSAQPPTRGYLLGLLTVLPPSGDAVAPLVALLDAGVAEELLPRAIAHQGAAAVEPLLAVAKSDRLDGFGRGLAAQLALACAADVGEVCVELRGLLKGFLDRGDALTEDERDLVCSLALDLAQIGDRAAGPLLRRAAKLGHGGLTSLAELTGLLDAPPPGDEPPLEWLAEYRERFDEQGYEEFDKAEEAGPRNP